LLKGGLRSENILKYSGRQCLFAEKQDAFVAYQGILMFRAPLFIMDKSDCIQNCPYQGKDRTP